MGLRPVLGTLGTSMDYRHYPGDVAIIAKNGGLNDPKPGYRYTFRDRLGSIAAMADQSGYPGTATGPTRARRPSIPP